MDDLLTILLVNGTGLLKGLCRCDSHENFDEWDKTNQSEITLTLSMHDRSIGTFKLYIDSGVVSNFPPQTTNDYSGLILDTDPKMKVWIEFCWGDSDFGYFRAVLQK